MAQINRSSDYFRIKTYTGNATNDTAITWDESSNMQPDFLWFKNRSQAQSHALFDVIRGADKRLISNSTGAEGTEATNLDSFDTNGFTVDFEAIVNGSGDNMVTWGWSAGGTPSSNTDGSITSNVSASTTSGFSIVSYTGTGATGTIGHGLGTAPQVIIWKNRDATGSWLVWHHSLPLSSSEYQVGFLNLTNGFAPLGTYNLMNATAPTSSVFTTDAVPEGNGSGDSIIAYCFAEKKGFSKAFSYTGNGSADGSFCYLGFKPAFIMIKSSSISSDWNIWDNKRPDYNVVNRSLEPHQSDAETVSAGRDIDILSNGFKARGTSSSINSSGATYVGIAFAESPLVGTNNTPAVAR